MAPAAMFMRSGKLGMSKNIVLDSLFGSDEEAPIHEETAESRGSRLAPLQQQSP